MKSCFNHIVLLFAILLLSVSAKAGNPPEGQADFSVYFEQKNIVHARCYAGSDGSAELTIEGGVPPYQIFWDISANFLSVIFSNDTPT